MSSTNSPCYYRTVSSGRPGGQSLPPLRSVLGDQLDLPFAHTNHRSPYDLGEIYKALPRDSGDFSDYKNPLWSTPIHTPHADSRHALEHPRSHSPYTYPSISTRANRQTRSVTPGHHDHRYASRGSPHTTSSNSGTSKKYACTWEGCEKRFERQHALDTHMNIHLEQKPFACPVHHCGKVFNVRSNMRRHLLTHKDVHMDGHLAHDDGGEDDGRVHKNYHGSRHEPTSRRSSDRPRAIAPAQGYYSSPRKA